ncbi:MAG: OB-fold nucleic acid binding domain-containing protein, partial [Anaerovibrio slackiae]|uniref:OB-fold nucleic acid binding domain-containing protein n=1 Tax=Anaerovibrio slackiae TaxID=2652309 RepID=UPI0023F19616
MDNTPAVEQDMNELLKVRRDKLAAFEAKGVAPFGYRFEVSHHANEVLEQFEHLEGEAESEEEITIAGRLMAIRGHGKASFSVLMDRSGRIQIYFKLDVLGEEKYSQFKLLDIGDIIGV